MNKDAGKFFDIAEQYITISSQEVLAALKDPGHFALHSTNLSEFKGGLVTAHVEQPNKAVEEYLVDCKVHNPPHTRSVSEGEIVILENLGYLTQEGANNLRPHNEENCPLEDCPVKWEL